MLSIRGCIMKIYKNGINYSATIDYMPNYNFYQDVKITVNGIEYNPDQPCLFETQSKTKYLDAYAKTQNIFYPNDASTRYSRVTWYNALGNI